MFSWKFKILKVGNVLGRGFLKTFFTWMSVLCHWCFCILWKKRQDRK